MGNLICWLKDHKFDRERYERDLREFYRFNNKPWMICDAIQRADWTREKFDKWYDENYPKAFCKRCNKSI